MVEYSSVSDTYFFSVAGTVSHTAGDDILKGIKEITGVKDAWHFSNMTGDKFKYIVCIRRADLDWESLLPKIVEVFKTRLYAESIGIIYLDPDS